MTQFNVLQLTVIGMGITLILIGLTVGMTGKKVSRRFVELSNRIEVLEARPGVVACPAFFDSDDVPVAWVACLDKQPDG